MRLNDITATAHPNGNRIDLSWTNPNPGAFPGVRVVRRQGTHPKDENDGVVVAHALGLLSASEDALQGETVYYYSLIPFRGPLNAPQFEDDPNNRASAMATSRFDFGGQMYALLPALYHRYDAVRTLGTRSDLKPEDRDKGPLRRFLDLPGVQFDSIYSLTRSALNLHDLDRAPGGLLPILAQWVGWQTDFSLSIGAQRNEIRFAPQIYQTTGLIPTIEATVKRITGWESRTKEFVHNVARTNQPERLNLWSMTRAANGAFDSPALASLDFVYSGRPAAVVEAGGEISLFYHAGRLKAGAPATSSLLWDIWSKRFAGGKWEGSAPVADQFGLDKNPTAVRVGTKLTLYWENFDPSAAVADRKWRIHFRTRDTVTSGGSPPTFSGSPTDVFGDKATSRRMPAAVADDAGGIWLFWLEQTTSGWRLKYSRNAGTPVDFPLDGGQDPRVEADLFVLFHRTSAGQRLWLFWARQDAGGPPGQSRWSIAYRFKQGLDPAVTNRLVAGAHAAEGPR